MYSPNRLVSFIIPVYNASRYLPRCIESILSQDHKCTEIIAVNDASQDDSLEILERYGRSNQNINLITFAENEGLGSARNAGLEVAEGDFIGFVDADDWIDSRFASDGISAIEEKGCHIAAFGMKNEYGNAASSEIRFSYSKENVIDSSYALKLLCRQFNSDLYMSSMVTNKIYKRTILDKAGLNFDPESQDNDVEFTFKLLTESSRIGLLSTAFYHYDQHPDSMIHTISKKTVYDLIRTFTRIKTFLTAKEIFVSQEDNFYALFDKCSSTMVNCIMTSPLNERQKCAYLALFYRSAIEFFPMSKMIEQVGLTRISRLHGL